jgi:hypothetical protein
VRARIDGCVRNVRGVRTMRTVRGVRGVRVGRTRTAREQQTASGARVSPRSYAQRAFAARVACVHLCACACRLLYMLNNTYHPVACIGYQR